MDTTRMEIALNPSSYFRVTDPSGNTRFETLSQHDAEQHATKVYRDEKVICNIDEVSRDDYSNVSS
jgi:hypothetical protein